MICVQIALSVDHLWKIVNPLMGLRATQLIPQLSASTHLPECLPGLSSDTFILSTEAHVRARGPHRPLHPDSSPLAHQLLHHPPQASRGSIRASMSL